MSDEIETAKTQLRQAEKNLKIALERKYVIGSKVKIRWMHDSTPLCEVIALRHNALRVRLLEPVKNRARSMGVFQDVGYETWIIIDNVIEVV